MDPFSFLGINAVSFGIGRVEQLVEDIAELNRETSEVLVISDAGVAKAGILDRIRIVLERSGYDVTVFSELAGEPHAATVDKAGLLLRRLDHPFVVGVGGGSPLMSLNSQRSLQKMRFRQKIMPSVPVLFPNLG